MKALLLGSIFIVFASASFAQSAIFNVPTTDTQAKRSFYVEGDLFTHFSSFRKNGFATFGPSVLYGLSGNVEVGANLYIGKSEELTTVELQPNIKWRLYENTESGVAASAGSLMTIPLDGLSGSKTAAVIYANLSKRLESAKGMRLTGGAYYVWGERRNETNKGVLIGVEQPVSKDLTLLADWSSGNNRFGYASVGFGYEVSKSQFLMAGYSIGNAGRSNNYFTAVYGFTF